MNKRIDEIDMIKGILILFVIFTHASGFSGLKGLFPTMAHLCSTFSFIAMTTFFIMSGYTYHQGKKTVLGTMWKRIRAIIIPYYAYCIPMLIFLFVFFILIEHRTMAWFLDGILAILLQLQSTYIFSNGVRVHEMMYSVFACWFIFQLLVSFLVFIPIYDFIENKKIHVKIVTSFVLLGIGALLYHLNIQHLNGEIFPPVCKMFVLPNIFGIAGLLMIGKCASLINLLDIKKYGKGKYAIYAIVSFVIIIIAYLTDDYLYDFPIGKWGAFKELSYFITPIYGLAFMIFLGYLAYIIKKNEIVKKILLFFGKNSLDFLILHFLLVWMISYLGGFWVPSSSGIKLPVFNPMAIWIHFIITTFLTLMICSVVVILRNNHKRACLK